MSDPSVNQDKPEPELPIPPSSSQSSSSSSSSSASTSAPTNTKTFVRKLSTDLNGLIQGITSSFITPTPPTQTNPTNGNDTSTIKKKAGSTFTSQLNSSTEPPSSTFALRVGPNYKKKGNKAPSAKALYKHECTDFFTSNNLHKDSSKLFTLPDHIEECSIKYSNEKVAGTNVPYTLIVNVGIPRDSPSVFSTPTDGKAFHVIFIFTLTEEVQDQIKKDVTNAPLPAAVRLLVEYFERAEREEKVRGRFKAMCVIDEIEKVGLPSFINVHNGKPVLINKSGTLTRRVNSTTTTSSSSGIKIVTGSESEPKTSNDNNQYQHQDTAEFHINIFTFNILARKALYSMHSKFKDLTLHVAFTIEGREDYELPEVVLGCGSLKGVDLERAPGI